MVFCHTGVLRELLWTKTSLSWWKVAHREKREGKNGSRLSSSSFPRSIALHHQSLAFGARFYAKYGVPEEEAATGVLPSKFTIASAILVSSFLDLDPFSSQLHRSQSRPKIRELKIETFSGRRQLQPDMTSSFVGYCACLCSPPCRRGPVGDVKLVCLALWRKREYLTFISIRFVPFSNQNFADYRS